MFKNWNIINHLIPFFSFYSLFATNLNVKYQTFHNKTFLKLYLYYATQEVITEIVLYIYKSTLMLLY